MTATAALLLGLLAGHALSHPRHDRLLVERERVVLELRLEVPSGDEAVALKRLFDRSGDGSLDAQEAGAASEYLARTAVLFARLFVDGLPVPLSREQVLAGGLAGETRDSSGCQVQVRLTAALPAQGDAPRVLRLEDRDRDRLVDVPVHAEVGEGLSIAAASPEATGGAAVVELALLEERALELAVVLARPRSP